ncbi:RNA polymerase sigma factor [Candidatus Sumerlaeota bacterium]
MTSDSRNHEQDRALAKGLRQGGKAAWSRFYDLYAAGLYRFVLARVGYREDRAADISQDAVVVAIERIKHYDWRRGSLWSWLCGIALNKCRESARRETRSGKLRQELAEQAPQATSPPLEESTHSQDPMFVLTQLHPRHQEALRLKYLEGLSVRDVAERLDVSEKAVESRLSRARESFRKAYKSQEEEPANDDD